MGSCRLKRVLVVTDAFGKPLFIPRMRFLCDYLRLIGVEVCVVTEKFEPLLFRHEYPIYEIALYHCQNGILKYIEWGVKNILALLFDYKNIVFSRKVRVLCKDKNFDIVCCSTFHTFALRAALATAKEKQVPLHVDIRDLAEQCEHNEYTRYRFVPLLSRTIGLYYRNVNKHRRDRILRQAACVTSVSPWHVSFLKALNKNAHLIYNGYDPALFLPRKVSSDKFKVVYAGKWYDERLQDVGLLFASLRKMLQDDLLDKQEFVVEWFTSEDCQRRLRAAASVYGLDEVMSYKNYVSNVEVPNVLNGSSVVLVLTNVGTHGIMTTKFFEAIGVEKPVLCVRSDEGLLAKAIKDANAGVAASSVDEVVKFLLSQYEQWKAVGYTHANVTAEAKRMYSRKEQAMRFVELFEKSIE